MIVKNDLYHQPHPHRQLPSSSENGITLSWPYVCLSKGRIATPKRMKFQKSFKRPLNPPPLPPFFGKSYCNFCFQYQAQKALFEGLKSAI